MSKLIKVLESLPEKEKRRLGENLGIVIAQPVSYLIYRRMGAPKWAAWGLVAIVTRLYAIEREIKDAA